MAVYIFTGKLGGGKTLCSVGRIRDKLRAGCTVATNLDLDLVAMFGRKTRALNVIRMPDKPRIEDMVAIGRGNLSYDENQNGLIVLDECGTWFNARNWNDKDRKPVNDWFLHARKLGWDVILIIQDIKLLDSQARDALAEHTVFCKRLDRIQVPYIGALWKMVTGFRLGGPRVHVARAVYGTSITDLVADRWVYRGNDLFRCYNTKQLFLDDYDHSVFSMLTPWHLRGRYAVPFNREFFMRLTRIYFKRFSKVLVLAAGVAVGIAAGILLDNIVTPAPAVASGPDPLVPVPAPAPEVPAPAPVDKPLPAIADTFKGFRIATYIQSEKKSAYSISDGTDFYTDKQLRAMGYIVSMPSNCEMRISRSGNYQDRAVLYADNCVPRPFDKPALDLGTIPAFESIAYADDSFGS